MKQYKTKSEELAWKIRRHAVEMVHMTHASHIGSILSVADIVAVLYTDILNVKPESWDDPDRDRFILSKGHAGVAVYAALAEMGFFPAADLERYYQDGSVYSGHVSHIGVPGVELSTGSLGHGFAVACGMALAAKRRKKDWRVYAVIGDGECNEGVIWETAMVAHQYKLNNLITVIDRNGMQAMGDCEKLMQMEPLAEKWRSFGWDVVEVADGNDHQQLRQAFNKPMQDVPRCVIAKTVKGKGVSFMENQLLWHYRDPQGDYYDRAVRELEEQKCATL